MEIPVCSKEQLDAPGGFGFNGQVYLEEIILFSEQWLTPKGQQ
jgi:hypothetical protein